jgi:hypothetical protein
VDTSEPEYVFRDTTAKGFGGGPPPPPPTKLEKAEQAAKALGGAALAVASELAAGTKLAVNDMVTTHLVKPGTPLAGQPGLLELNRVSVSGRCVVDAGGDSG